MRHTQTLDVIQQPKKYMEKYARAFLDRQENCGGMTSAPPLKPPLVAPLS